MDKDILLDVLQAAYHSRNFSEARLALDEWEYEQERTRNTLSFLRFHRQQLEQTEVAVAIAQEMLNRVDSDMPTQMCDHLALGQLYLEQDNHDDAWHSLANVLNWRELPEYYDVGMARSAIEMCMDIALATTDETLAMKSFNAGIDLLNAGSSVSPNGLNKAGDAAYKLRQTPKFEAYRKSAHKDAR